MDWKVDLENTFRPKVVAVIGVASNARREAPAILGGAAFIRACEHLVFTGSIYIVDPGATEILGSMPPHRFRLSLRAPDLAISYVVPNIPEDCIAANVKKTHP